MGDLQQQRGTTPPASPHPWQDVRVTPFWWICRQGYSGDDYSRPVVPDLPNPTHELVESDAAATDALRAAFESELLRRA